MSNLPRRKMTSDEYARMIETKEKRGAIIRLAYLDQTPPDTLVMQDPYPRFRDGHIRLYVKIYHPSLAVVPEAAYYPEVGPDLKAYQ